MTEDASTSIPELAITWREPWRQFEDAEHQRPIQDELEREVGVVIHSGALAQTSSPSVLIRKM